MLFFTANYYLTDVTEPKHGGTEVIPGSHLFGAPCPPVIEAQNGPIRCITTVGRPARSCSSTIKFGIVVAQTK
ncbi:MAG: hypothetical protein R2867_41315 [Caldilineaceae bacterium]